MKHPPFNLNYRFGADLREIPEDSSSMQAYVDLLIQKVREIPSPSPNGDGARSLVKLLGEIGAYAKILGKLDAAERALEKSLSLIDRYQLGIEIWAVHTLRYADVLRFRGQALEAETAFRSVLEMRQRDPSLADIEDFAWQHLGKLLFDQADWKGAEGAFQRALELRKSKNSPELLASTEFALRILQNKAR